MWELLGNSYIIGVSVWDTALREDRPSVQPVLEKAAESVKEPGE